MAAKVSYRTNRASYLRFNAHVCYPPLPAQSSHLFHHAALLARCLKPNSIPNYLNIIGLLHKEFTPPNPLIDNWPLQSLLAGIKRVKGTAPAQKLPITPSILESIYSHLNLRSNLDASSWAICLVTSYFGMLRKKHLLVKSSRPFNASQQLLRSDFTFYPWGALVTIQYYTIQ